METELTCSGARADTNLSDGNGSTERLNDNYFLQLGSTLFDDGQRDTLLGANKRQWHVLS